MKVIAPLRTHVQRFEEQVHEEGLPATDLAPDIESTDGRPTAAEKPQEPPADAGFACFERMFQCRKPVDHRSLFVVPDVTFASQALFPGLSDIHAVSGPVALM
jgi:hypothetical protein